MRLFSKKAPAQEEELEQFALALHELRLQSRQAVLKMHAETRDLYNICRQAVREKRALRETEPVLSIVQGRRRFQYIPRTPIEKVGIYDLIEKAKEALQTYKDSLLDIQARVLPAKPDEWYPRKYKKTYEAWVLQLNNILKYIDTATLALQAPAPLRHTPGQRNDKLTIFIGALNQVALLAHEKTIPEDLVKTEGAVQNDRVRK